MKILDDSMLENIFKFQVVFNYSLQDFSFVEEPNISWDDRVSDGGKCFLSGADVYLLM